MPFAIPSNNFFKNNSLLFSRASKVRTEVVAHKKNVNKVINKASPHCPGYSTEHVRKEFNHDLDLLNTGTVLHGSPNIMLAA